MKRRHFLQHASSAAVGLGAATISAAADESTDLRVLCYNIHFGQGMDGEYDLERLAKVIRAEKPDLVALQEIDVVVRRSGKVHQLRRLAELTGMEGRYGPTQHYQGGLYGNGVLSRLPIRTVTIDPLPYTEATAELTTYPRGAIATTVDVGDGRMVRLVSTHFQHNLEEDRIEQAKAINALFGDRQAAPLPTILAGDMNAVPGSPPMKILDEVWTNAIDAEAAPTAPSPEPRSRIDYVFYRTGDPLETVESRVVDEPMASDHRPVLAVLRLKD